MFYYRILSVHTVQVSDGALILYRLEAFSINSEYLKTSTSVKTPVCDRFVARIRCMTTSDGQKLCHKHLTSRTIYCQKMYLTGQALT